MACINSWVPTSLAVQGVLDWGMPALLVVSHGVLPGVVLSSVLGYRGVVVLLSTRVACVDACVPQCPWCPDLISSIVCGLTRTLSTPQLRHYPPLCSVWTPLPPFKWSDYPIFHTYGGITTTRLQVCFKRIFWFPLIPKTFKDGNILIWPWFFLEKFIKVKNQSLSLFSRWWAAVSTLRFSVCLNFDKIISGNGSYLMPSRRLPHRCKSCNWK